MSVLWPEKVWRKLSDDGKEFFFNMVFTEYIKKSVCKDCTRKFVSTAFEKYIRNDTSSSTRIINEPEKEMLDIFFNFLNAQTYNDYPELREKFPEAFI